MNRYEIVLANGYGRELHRETVGASELRLALLISSALLEGHPEAVSASVELLGELGEPDRRWQQDGVEEAEPCWRIADDGDAYQPLTPAELDEASIGLGEIDGSES